MSVVKWTVWAALGVAAAALQGLAVFRFREFPGPFLSLTGLECAAVPLIVELVLAVVVIKNLDELHARSVANPHSLLGQALRQDGANPPPPPAARDAWTGGFEDMNDASDKMRKGR